MKRATVVKIAIMCGCAMPLPAMAQAAAPAEVAAPAAPGGLAEIIVTATRRSENLQKVPVSVTAISSDKLKSQGVFSTADMNNSIPNLQVSSAYGETQPNFTLRGVGVGTEYNSNAASPVGVYVDEVYQSFRAAQGQQLYDLAQVEVVRGPQGTLYGRNTTGGAINFNTNKPSLHGQNGYLTVGYGSYNRRSAEGAIELTPIEDVLGIRIAGNYVKANPYIKNVYPGGISPGGAESFGLRGQIRFRPSPGVDLSLKLYASQSSGGQDSPQNHGPSLTDDTISLANSALAFFYTPLASTLFGNGHDLSKLFPQAYSASGSGLSTLQIKDDQIGTAVVKTFGAVLSAKIDLADRVKLISSTEYDQTHFGLLPTIDCDGTPYPVCAIGYESKSKSFNQDLRIDYTGDQLKLIGGVYYGYDRIVTNNTPHFYDFLAGVNAAVGNPLTHFNPGGLTGDGLITPLDATQNYTQERTSAAIYGEGSYAVTSKLKLTAGLRYTNDHFGYLDALTTFYDGTGAARLYTVSDYAAGNYTIGVSPGAANPLNRRDKSSSLTGRAIVDYQLADRVLAYASYSRGYRGGTYNGLAFQSAKQVYFVRPETVDAFEFGVKSRFFDNRLQFNASVFHYTYKNQQQQLLDPSSVTFLINLDGKETGLDADLEFAATDTLHLTASLGVLDSKFDHANCPSGAIGRTPPQQGNCISTAGGNIDVGGNPFPYASKVSANIGADWKVLKTATGTVTLHADTSYTGHYYYDVFGGYNYVGANGSSVNQGKGPIRQGGGDYWLINGRISYKTDHYSLAAYVKNLTDKVYYPNAINVEGSYGSDYFIRAAPRTFGAEFSMKF